MSDTDSRKAFEDACRQRWAGDRGALTLDEDGEYVNGPVQFAWIAFQWGINHAAKLRAEEKPVAYLEPATGCMRLVKDLPSSDLPPMQQLFDRGERVWLILRDREAQPSDNCAEDVLARIEAVLAAAPQVAAIPPPQDVGSMEYEGNTVSYLKEKMLAYGDGIRRAWRAMADIGFPADGDTPLDEAIRAIKPAIPPDVLALLREARQELVVLARGAERPRALVARIDAVMREHATQPPPAPAST